MHHPSCGITPFFILSTSFCSLSSWFTSFYTHITSSQSLPSLLTSITLSTFYSRLLICFTNPFLHIAYTVQSLSFHLNCLRGSRTCTELCGHWCLFWFLFHILYSYSYSLLIFIFFSYLFFFVSGYVCYRLS